MSLTFSPANEIKTDLTAGLTPQFFRLNLNEQLAALKKLVDTRQLPSYELFLPFVLQLNGKPYTLRDHFAFQTLYRTDCPRVLTVMSGRQVAKCVRISEHNRVALANGRPVAGHELRIGDAVMTVDDNYRAASGVVVNKFDSGLRDVLRITTRLGNVLEVATTHPLRVLPGWVASGDLRVGARIAAARRGGTFGTAPLDDRAILTAYMIGDGCCGCSGNWSFTAMAGEALDEFVQLANRYEEQGVRLQPKDDTIAVAACVHRDNRLLAWLREDGLAYKYSYEKFIPGWVFELSETATAGFLSRLWATDGRVACSDNGTPSITYCSTSARLADDVRALLRKLGIPSSVAQNPASYRDDVTGELVECRDAYLVRVETREGWRRFMAQCRVPGKPAVPLPKTAERNNRDTIPLDVSPLLATLAATMRGRRGTSLCAAGLRVKPKYPLTYGKARQYLQYFQEHCPAQPRLNELQCLVESDVIWDEIVSIEPIGQHACWDVEIETQHNYVLNGLVSHNSTNLASNGVLQANIIPNYKILFVAPLYEQIRRFSNNYVRPFINSSPLKQLWTNTKTENSVLQKTFANGSLMLFTFALLDSSRVRGISSHELAVDEIQDMDPNHIPIIEEVLSASKYKLRKRTGTPKSFDNPMADTYDKGSQAHWQVKCWHCGKYSIAALEHHLLKMIGPIREDISADAPGLICAFCEKPINPRPPWGRWYHEYPSRRLEHSSYHIPQIILPMHYSRRFEWSEVHRKAESYGQARFFNEVLGVPCDFGQRLISSAELRKASDLPWRNNPNSPDPQIWARLPHYEYKVLSIDWGGGGADEVSYTVLTLMGMRPDGVIDVLWGKRMLMSVNHVSEAEETMQWARRFNVDVVIHDYSGAGSLRETFLLQAGMIESRSMPISLVGNLSQDFVRYVPPTAIHGRAYYQLAKTRSLLYMFQALRCGYVHLFQYEDGTQENRSLHEHFLSLVEEKTETRHAGDLYVITRNTKNPDDFAQAVNMGCAGLWYISKRWPDFSRSVRNTSLTAEQEQIIGSNRMGFETDPRNMDELWPG